MHFFYQKFKPERWGSKISKSCFLESKFRPSVEVRRVKLGNSEKQSKSHLLTCNLKPSFWAMLCYCCIFLCLTHTEIYCYCCYCPKIIYAYRHHDYSKYIKLLNAKVPLAISDYFLSSCTCLKFTRSASCLYWEGISWLWYNQVEKQNNE